LPARAADAIQGPAAERAAVERRGLLDHDHARRAVPDGRRRSARRSDRQRGAFDRRALPMNGQPTQVKIDEVVSRVRAIDGTHAIAPETVRTLVAAILP